MTRPLVLTAGLLFAALTAPAAPVPADPDRPKPRPRLTATAAIPAEVEDVIWLPDAKHLVLKCGDGTARVIRRDQFGDDEPAVKPVAELKLPPRAGELQLGADGEELYTLAATGGKLTTESRAYFWSVKRLLDGKDGTKPDRIVSLEVDVPSAGTLVGRQFVVPVVESRKVPGPNLQPGFGGAPGGMPGGWDGSDRRPTEYTARFDRLNAKTGDKTGEWARFDDADASFAAHAVDAKTGRMYVQLHAAEETLVRCLDLSTGKQVWERKLAGQPHKQMTTAPVPSRDGGLLAVTQSVLVARPVGQPGGGPARGGQPQRVSYTVMSGAVLLNAKTGDPIDLPLDEGTTARFTHFSADGRLLVGFLTRENSAGQVAVWDTKTGKVVRTWNTRGNVIFEFAPSGHELLVVERERKEVYGPSVAVPQGYGQGGQQWTTTREVIRTDHKSVLGVWDLTSLAK